MAPLRRSDGRAHPAAPRRLAQHGARLRRPLVGYAFSAERLELTLHGAGARRPECIAPGFAYHSGKAALTART